MTTMREKDLDDLLSLAAANRPAPGPELMERVLADALATRQDPVAPRPRPSTPSGFFQQLSHVFGGGAVLAGVTSTLLLGLVVGYLNPATLDYLTGGTAEAIELFPDGELLTSEG
jgi:hypothetical protein